MNTVECKYLIVSFISLFLISLNGSSLELPDGYWLQKKKNEPCTEDYKLALQFYKGENDSIKTKAIWLFKGFYNNEFEFENIQIDSTGSFRMYAFDCCFSGKIIQSNNEINATFTCPDDTSQYHLVKKQKEELPFLFSDVEAQLYNKSFSYKIPDFINDGWEVGHAAKHHLDPSVIEKMIHEMIDEKYGHINSFLIVKNGKLVCEKYFWGYNRNVLHRLESSTKSISSLLVGIAFDQGKLTSMNEKLVKFFPEYSDIISEKTKEINLHQLLTMTAGFKRDQIDDMFDSGEDWFGYILSRPIVEEPGSSFFYDYGSSMLMAGIVKQATGLHADIFAQKYLFNPLQIKTYNWDILKNNGFPLTSGSLEMLPRDFAKIGQLVLDKGKWKGRQIVSENWISLSTKAHIESHIKGDFYGYQWWRITLKTGNNTYETIWANGMGSQFLYIVPELNMVIACTGTNGDNSWDFTKLLEKYIEKIQLK